MTLFESNLELWDTSIIDFCPVSGILYVLEPVLCFLSLSIIQTNLLLLFTWKHLTRQQPLCLV